MTNSDFRKTRRIPVAFTRPSRRYALHCTVVSRQNDRCYVMSLRNYMDGVHLLLLLRYAD